MMADPIFVKETHYFIQGIDLDQPLTDDRGFDAARSEVTSLQQRIKQALSEHPESVRILDESEVPAPPTDGDRECFVCSYTKVVNFETVEHWPPFEEDSGRGCEDCGLQVKSHTEVVNNQLVKDVVETWGMQHVQVPQA
jgi:hypothetical protein